MLDHLLLHPTTKEQIARYLNRPFQALLISGVTGSGKETLSKVMAANILKIPEEKLHSYPYLLIIKPINSTIPIESIRSIKQFLHLKTAKEGNKQFKRVVIIKNAEQMRSEGQNALLKTLEEPPADTIFILTANSTTTLLPTVYSRLREINVLPVSQEAALDFFKTSKLKKYYPLSQGQVGLLHALLHEEQHPLILYVEKSKQILRQSPENRLLLTEELSKNKDSLSMLLNALQRIIYAGLSHASVKNDQREIIRWYGMLSAVTGSNSLIQTKANIKLMLDNLFLSL